MKGERGLFWIEGIAEDQAWGVEKQNREHHPHGRAERIFGIIAYSEEHNTHRDRRLTSLCTKLVYNRKKSYITLHLRTESNTCQLDRFIIRIKCDTIYVCVLKNRKHFTNRKGLLLLVGDRNKKEYFDQNTTCLHVSVQSPAMAHQ